VHILNGCKGQKQKQKLLIQYLHFYTTKNVKKFIIVTIITITVSSHQARFHHTLGCQNHAQSHKKGASISRMRDWQENALLQPKDGSS
jgi:hypothetical protein